VPPGSLAVARARQVTKEGYVDEQRKRAADD
jgi:bifunctional N-acetylglucosamine-1-phosphate-uridyltransferase/glucosamine-1-phosphate-acetyltransferase GlmU-like protein